MKRSRRSSQEVVERNVSRGLVVSGEIAFFESPETEVFSDDGWGGCSTSVDSDGTFFILKVFTPDPMVRDFYRSVNGDKRYSVNANDKAVVLVCFSGDQRQVVGKFSGLAEAVLRSEEVWSELSHGIATVVRTGTATIGTSMPLDKWNELMQGADLVEAMTDDEVSCIIENVEETLEAEVYVTEVIVRVYDVR